MDKLHEAARTIISEAVGNDLANATLVWHKSVLPKSVKKLLQQENPEFLEDDEISPAYTEFVFAHPAQAKGKYDYVENQDDTGLALTPHRDLTINGIKYTIYTQSL